MRVTRSRLVTSVKTESLDTYCMKCKKKVEMREPKEEVTRNNRPIAKGICPECGGRVARILSHYR